MPRYQGESPFQSLGVVCNGTSGILLLSNNARNITEKPKLSFAFDALYCEPTLCHRFYKNEEQALNQTQINAVMKYLISEDNRGELVNGVNSDGAYVEGVLPNQVVRTVNAPPPKEGSWRFDFSKGPGDHWYQAWCVDSLGNYIGNINEEDSFAVITTPYPLSNPWGEVWKWDFSSKNWIDSRSVNEILLSVKEIKKARAWSFAMELFENSNIVHNINGVDYIFECNYDTRENIMAINTAISSGISISDPRPYYPKGITEPIMLSHDDFKNIGLKIMLKKDEIVFKYMNVKSEIMNITDIEQAKSYDVAEAFSRQNS